MRWSSRKPRPAVEIDSRFTVPVMICPVMARRDLLEGMLASIDVRVEKLVLIDNSPDGSMTAGMDGENRVILRPHHNLGVSASWNLGIKITPLSPLWIITNADVVFGPGDLGRIIEAMAEYDVVAMHGLAIFGFSRKVIERAGFFDENFIPAYYEDNDWLWRCRLAELSMTWLGTTSEHKASSTIKASLHFRSENNRTFPVNGTYYREKWGGMPFDEQYRSPRNAGGDFRAWTLSMERLRDLTWRPE